MKPHCPVRSIVSRPLLIFFNDRFVSFKGKIRKLEGQPSTLNTDKQVFTHCIGSVGARFDYPTVLTHANKAHLYRAHMQYRAFKEKRVRAETTDGVLTIQMDWSENQKVRQVQEEKGVYYHQDQYSIHAMRAWTKMGAFSHAAMSEETSHKATAVFASIEEVLQNYISEGITEINSVTDSPSSQYRTKNAFWLMKEFCVRYGIKLNWIFLEARHGKGIPDGIGGCVKRAMKDAVTFDPDAS